MLYIPWNFLPIFYILYSHHESFKKLNAAHDERTFEEEVERKAIIMQGNTNTYFGYGNSTDEMKEGNMFVSDIHD